MKTEKDDKNKSAAEKSEKKGTLKNDDNKKSNIDSKLNDS